MPQRSTDSPLSRRLFVAIITPVALLFIVGAMLTIQIVRMNETAHWVDHTDAVIARINDLQKQIIDQETGLRGYLLTGQRLFLEPYDRAHVLEAFDAIEQLVSDDPAAQSQLVETRARYVLWFRSTLDVVAPGASLDEPRRVESVALGKTRMDAVRTSVSCSGKSSAKPRWTISSSSIIRRNTAARSAGVA